MEGFTQFQKDRYNAGQMLNDFNDDIELLQELKKESREGRSVEIVKAKAKCKNHANMITDFLKKMESKGMDRQASGKTDKA